MRILPPLRPYRRLHDEIDSRKGFCDGRLHQGSLRRSMSSEPDPSSPDLEQELCLSCLHLNGPDAHFCGECGAPLTSYSATAPFESIFAEGHFYRRAVERPESWLVLAGVWFYFGLFALGGAVVIARGTSDPSSLGFGMLITVPSVVIIARSTANFRRIKNLVTRDS